MPVPELVKPALKEAELVPELVNPITETQTSSPEKEKPSPILILESDSVEISVPPLKQEEEVQEAEQSKMADLD